jgi:hypothetical protein
MPSRALMLRPVRRANPFNGVGALVRRAEVDTLSLENRRLKSRLERAVAAADEEIKQLFGDLTVVAGGGVAGVLQGAKGGDGVQVFGVPGEIALGAGLIGAAMLGLAGKDSHYLRKAGSGALAVSFGTFMRGVMIEKGKPAE